MVWWVPAADSLVVAWLTWKGLRKDPLTSDHVALTSPPTEVEVLAMATRPVRLRRRVGLTLRGEDSAAIDTYGRTAGTRQATSA